MTMAHILYVLIALTVLGSMLFLAILCVKKRKSTGRAIWLPPMLLVGVAGWLWFYETKIVACPDCNIRPDIAIVWPVCIAVCVLSFIAFVRDLRTS